MTHVDLFLSTVRPYWPDETKVRSGDAGMGPLGNSAGMYLTAINYQRSLTDQPDPFGDVRAGAPLDQSVRGVASKLDPSGFLWVCEKMIPRSNSARRHHRRLREARRRPRPEPQRGPRWAPTSHGIADGPSRETSQPM